MKKRLLGITAGLVSLSLLSGCSGWSPTVVKTGDQLVEAAPLKGDLPNLPNNPVDAQLDWTLYYAPLNGADTKGLAVAEGPQRLYMGMANGMVTAFYRQSQPTWADQVAWQLLLDSPVLAGPLLLKNTLYVGTADGQLVALNPRNGQVRWMKQLSSSIDARLVASDDLLLVRTLDSKLYALDPDNGEVRWEVSHEAPALALQGESAPVVVEDTVVVGWENGLLEGLNLANGEVKWQQRLAQPKGSTDLERMVDIQATPYVYNDQLYAVAFHGKLASLDPYTGRIYWVKDLSSYRDMAFAKDRLLVVDDEDIIHAVDLITGTEIWKQPRFKFRQLTDLRLSEAGRHVLVGDKAGQVHWLDVTNGQETGRLQHNSAPVANLFVLKGQRLVLIDGEGYISLYRIHHE